MRIAVIGHGMMGERHVEALRALGYTTSIVVGHDEGRTKAFAVKEGISRWSVNPDDVFNGNYDTVHICTPPANHYELVRKALEKGMHVVCEKPFVLRQKDGEELVALAAKKKVVNAIGFNTRYHQACANARELVSSGKMGEILLVNGSYMQEFHALPSFFSWRYKPESAGKFLATTEIGSHWIDLMRYLTGEKIESVSATYASFFPDRVIKDGKQYLAGSCQGTPFHSESDNVALVTFHLEKGALANMVLSEITPGRYNYLEMTVTGTDRSFWWNSEDLNRLHVGWKNHPVEEHVFAFGDGFNDSVTNMLRDVYCDIEKGNIPEGRRYATFADGLENVKVCEAIYKSACNNGEWESVE